MSVLDSARERAESLMSSVVRVTRGDGQVWDEDSGSYVPAVVVVYEGPGRVRFPAAMPRETDAAGSRVVEQSPTLSLPVASSGGVTVDDVAVVTSNPDDPAVVGTRLRVAGVHAQTQSSARRFPVEVLSYG